jgi:hypothetical protein
VSGHLHELLPTLEKVKLGDLKFSAEEHERKLEPILGNR